MLSLFMHPINVLCSERVRIFLWFLCCGAIILVNDHCATVRRRSLHHVEEAFLTFSPHVHSCYYLPSLCYLHPPSDQHVTVTKGGDAFKAGRGRVLSIAFKRGWRFLPIPQWNPLWWICNEHNLQDVILILYLSAFVCKLSIMVKKGKRILHAFVLGFVMRWLCLMFDTVFCIEKEKNTRLWML